MEDSLQRFWASTGIDFHTNPGDFNLELADQNQPVNSGILESSTFDTGISSPTYTNYSILPQQVIEEGVGAVHPIRFKIATSRDLYPNKWNYVGPLGNENSYFVDGDGGSISTADQHGRYIRYKFYLSPTYSGGTPRIGSMSITAVGQPTSGQVLFTNIPYSNNYGITIHKDGYEDMHINTVVSQIWQQVFAGMTPN
jgi:hypothetical protein